MFPNVHTTWNRLDTGARSGANHASVQEASTANHTEIGHTDIGSLPAQATVRNITLTADESLIEAARQRARIEHTTLNEQFRCWRAEYARTPERMQQYDAVMAELRGQLKVGRKLSRDEMNER